MKAFVFSLIALFASAQSFADASGMLPKYHCKADVEGMNQISTDIYHDGNGPHGGPSNGKGSIVMWLSDNSTPISRELFDDAPMILDTDDNGKPCTLITSVYKHTGFEIYYHFEIDTCNVNPDDFTVKGNAVVLSTYQGETYKFMGPMTCSAANPPNND
jgi:hypothetical protein